MVNSAGDGYSLDDGDRAAARVGVLLQGAGRAAPLGLTMLILTMGALGVWAASATRSVASQVDRAEAQRDALVQASAAIQLEESLERKYRLEPEPKVRAAHGTASADFVSALRSLSAIGSAEDGLLVAQALALHEGYQEATARLFAAVDAGDHSLALAIDNAEVDPVAHALHDLVQAASRDHHQMALDALERLAKTKDTIFIGALSGTAVAFALMAVTWGVLHVYRRRLGQSAEAQRDALAKREARFRALVQGSSDLITVVGPDLTIKYQSPASRHFLGRAPSELAGVPLTDLLHPDDAAQVAHFFASLQGSEETGTLHARLSNPAGGWRFVEARCTDRMADPSVHGFVLNSRDITDRLLLEAELLHAASHDILTGLASRTHFADQLALALTGRAERGLHVAVILMDIDDFRSINDAFGHQGGDEVLRQVASRIESCALAGETIARFGGDEIAVFAEVGGAAEALKLAERIGNAMKSPFPLAAGEARLSVSGGIAIGHPGSESAADLIRRADVALTAAKARGKAGFEVYDPNMHSAVIQRLSLASDVQQALARGELTLVYQPIVALADASVVGLEALVRWRHPRRGLLSPDQFISLAEETGAIRRIGEWVLSEACAQAQRWRDKSPVVVSVNASVKQLHDDAFSRVVEDVLRQTALPPAALTVELTESVMAAGKDAVRRLEELRALGVRIAIDDFGAGYSSLSYLARLPVDILKIDGSFVTELGRGNDKGLTRAIIAMAKSLGLETTAECIERPVELELLRRLGCDLGQGFFFSPPLEVDGVRDLLAGGPVALGRVA